MVGYISHRKPRAAPQVNRGPEFTTTPSVYEAPVEAAAPEPELDWADIRELLSQKLTAEAFDKTLR